jgi:hypothetical protein
VLSRCAGNVPDDVACLKVAALLTSCTHSESSFAESSNRQGAAIVESLPVANCLLGFAESFPVARLFTGCRPLLQAGASSGVTTATSRSTAAEMSEQQSYLRRLQLLRTQCAAHHCILCWQCDMAAAWAEAAPTMKH